MLPCLRSFSPPVPTCGARGEECGYPDADVRFVSTLSRRPRPHAGRAARTRHDPTTILPPLVWSQGGPAPYMPRDSCHMAHTTCHTSQLIHATCRITPMPRSTSPTCHNPHATCHMPRAASHTCPIPHATFHTTPVMVASRRMAVGVMAPPPPQGPASAPVPASKYPRRAASSK